MGEVILVVDDEDFVRRIIRFYLEEMGHEVVEAASSVEALDLLAEAPERFSALILDWMMPGLNGLDLLRRLRNDQQFSALPVIMQSAAAEPGHINQGIRAGANQYLTKPFGQEQLRATLDFVLSQSRRHIAARC